MSQQNKIRVIELFAGVGGFRIGLEGWNNKSAVSGYNSNLNSTYEVIWSNQYEPSTRIQHASLVYEARFGKAGHSNQDIETINPEEIPDFDLLVGGFPCQDYSIMTRKMYSKGLEGKKGALWWSIIKIIQTKGIRPKYLLLENVDRLLISPSQQRGRDFAIILESLNKLGYTVEWRIINAADYGMPQRRKRIFILAYHKTSHIVDIINQSSVTQWILDSGILAKAFPVSTIKPVLIPHQFPLKEYAHKAEIKSLELHRKIVFENAGIMMNGIVTTIKTIPHYSGLYKTLSDVIQKTGIEKHFYIDESALQKWIYLKGAKHVIKTNSQGHEYCYSEGATTFPDPLEKPSRTIITSEGGVSPCRYKHVIKTSKGFRRLTPVELERLNMFPDNHTKFDFISEPQRAFFMGNALVVGIVEKIGMALADRVLG